MALQLIRRDPAARSGFEGGGHIVAKGYGLPLWVKVTTSSGTVDRFISVLWQNWS